MMSDERGVALHASPPPSHPAPALPDPAPGDGRLSRASGCWRLAWLVHGSLLILLMPRHSVAGCKRRQVLNGATGRCLSNPSASGVRNRPMNREPIDKELVWPGSMSERSL